MPEPGDLNDLPQATIERPSRARISVVWIIPILAAVVALGIAVQRIVTEGPTITIVFKTAQGIEAGKTFVKYKDVNIGHVTTVQLTDRYGKVEVTAKIDKGAAGLIVADAKFWVVQPRVTLSGISGLGTLLSGNYIGFQAGKSDKKESTFTGLDVPPIIQEEAGRRFLLKADDLGTLGIGSPIYYRHLQAGEVAAYSLAADGKGIELTVFVNAPYDKYVTPETRFWNASGINVSVGAGGVDIRTEGLVAVVAGGLAFETPSFLTPTEPAVDNTAFTVYSDRASAMKQAETLARHYVLHFTESIRGLSVGAPVTLLGLPAGEVTDVGLDLDTATMVFRPRAFITFFPERIIARMSAQQRGTGKALFDESPNARLGLIRRMVEERGLRAMLRSGNILTGQLFVAFDYFPNAPKPTIDWTHDPPELPVVPSALPDLEAKLTSILAKIDSMPLEAIGKDLQKDLATLGQTLEGANTLLTHVDTTTLASVNQLLRNLDTELVVKLKTTVEDASKLLSRVDTEVVPELKSTLEGARRAMVTADQVLQNTSTLVGKDAPAQQELRDALQELVRTLRSIRGLADYLERHPESLIRGKTEEKK
jgi:paraquat-inducible protein B